MRVHLQCHEIYEHNDLPKVQHSLNPTFLTHQHRQSRTYQRWQKNKSIRKFNMEFQQIFIGHRKVLSRLVGVGGKKFRSMQVRRENRSRRFAPCLLPTSTSHIAYWKLYYSLIQRGNISKRGGGRQKQRTPLETIKKSLFKCTGHL